jgi:uncharacterized protein YxeA
MKKIKVALNSVAILAAIGGAFATYDCKECEDNAQYIPVNNSYHKVGEYGTDYNCSVGEGICTYYNTDSTGNTDNLLPCREGAYTPISN